MKTEELSVYFSKSNQSNPDDLIIVKEVLKQNFKEVNQYEGGAYSTDKIDKSDVLVILSYLGNGNDLMQKLDKYGNFLGKGGYLEVSHAIAEEKPCYSVDIFEDYVLLLPIVAINLHDTTNYKTRYGYVEVSEENQIKLYKL